MINIIIADDHKIFIEGIRTTLSDVDDINIVGQALNGKQLLELLRKVKADVVLLDINMPVMDGLQAAAVMKKDFNAVKIIMLTQYGEKRFIKKCEEIGAKGYLLKDCTKNVLIDTIRNVYNGGKHYSAGDDFNNGFPVPDLLNDVQISCKEKEVLELLTEEKNTGEIAKELKICNTTVKEYKERMFWKTGTKSIGGLIAWALRKRIIK